MTCPHCATAAPVQVFLTASTTTTAPSKPLQQARKAAASSPTKPTLPLAGHTRPLQGNPPKQRIGWAWVALILLAGVIGAAAIYLSLKNQTTLASAAPATEIMPESAIATTPDQSVDFSSPMMHEGLIRPLADRMLNATDVNAFAACFENGSDYLSEMESIWKDVKQLSPDILAITMAPITSLPDNSVVYLGVWPRISNNSQIWITLHPPIDTNHPKLNWPLFYHSYTQQIDKLLSAPSGQSAEIQVIAKRTHAFDLPDGLQRDYIPLLVQCTKNEAVLATAFIEKNTPKGEILASALQWNQTYLLNATLTRKTAGGTVITVISGQK